VVLVATGSSGTGVRTVRAVPPPPWSVPDVVSYGAARHL